MSPSVAPEVEEQIIAHERLRLLALGYYVKGAVGRSVRLVFSNSFLHASRAFVHPRIGLDPPPRPATRVESLSVTPSPTARPVNQGPPVIMSPNFRGGDWRDYFARLDVWRADHLRRALRAKTPASHLRLRDGWIELSPHSMGERSWASPRLFSCKRPSPGESLAFWR